MSPTLPYVVRHRSTGDPEAAFRRLGDALRFVRFHNPIQFTIAEAKELNKPIKTEADEIA